MEIFINGIRWVVLIVKQSDTRLLMPTGWTIGVTNVVDHTICISEGLSNEMLYKCISHEICHAIIFSYGLEMSIPDEECLCQIMENFSDDVLYYADRIYSNL